ncbi:MAG: HAD-IIB family hydrolase [Candidatus Promineifilaceae bacterium]|nr:HAD-IIB family hydrolase [Candidatus Promineifilaceae bacterium]
MNNKWILATDIDNTLTGNRAALDRLREGLEHDRTRYDCFLILSTGRRLDEVLTGFEEEGIPVPDAIISQVGTEIYLPPFRAGMAPLAEWDVMLRQQYDRAVAERFFQEIEGLELQPDRYNTRLKASCWLDQTPDPEAAANEIEDRVRQSEHGDAYQVVWSSGRDLDIIPAAAGKGKAIHFLKDHLGLEPDTVIVAGDSGNDRSMFEAFERGIIVANAKPELRQLAESERPGIYFAQRSYAAGVHEGLHHFGLVASRPAPV